MMFIVMRIVFVKMTGALPMPHVGLSLRLELYWFRFIKMLEGY